MYPTGWSHPNNVIRPWEGAILYLAAQTTLNLTLTGEEVPLPVPNYAVLNASEGTHVHRGYNLISARLAKQLGERTGDPATIFSLNKTAMVFEAAHYDNLDASWVPRIPPVTGSVWYKADQAPLNPAGEFSETANALYFNNYAPAYGIDLKFRGGNCEPITNGTAQLFRRLPSGAVEAVGAVAALSSEFPGYIDPSADLVRYVPGGSIYSIRIQSGSIFGETESSTAPAFDQTPPIFPLAMSVFYPKLAFRSEPQDASARPGATVELSAIFQRLNVLDPLVTLDVPYQWQKQSGPTWIDVPNATNATLRLENIDSADAGVYRLRATDCDDYYSRSATITLMAPRVVSEIHNGKLRLQVSLPVSTKALVQTSDDLEHWIAATPIDTPTNAWSGEIGIEADCKFFRVVEVP